MGRRLVDIEHETTAIIKKRVSYLDVAFFELVDRYLLFDELKEELLLVAYPIPLNKYRCLSFINHLI